MTAERSPFCPKYCKFKDDNDLGFVHDECHHNKDKVYDTPIPIEMIWYANVWIQALILGESEDTYIIQSPKAEGVTYIKKSSPLIKKI